MFPPLFRTCISSLYTYPPDNGVKLQMKVLGVVQVWKQECDPDIDKEVRGFRNSANSTGLSNCVVACYFMEGLLKHFFLTFGTPET